MHEPKLGPTERVYLRIKNDVVLQNFSFNERLIINELADRYAVSTTPVREALSRLHGEDLINFRYGHGYYCKTPTLRELRELYELLGIVLRSSLTKCSDLKRLTSEDCNTTELAGLAGIADSSFEDNDEKRQLVVHLTEGIVQAGGNMTSLNLVRNIHARTHFISRRAFVDACSATELVSIVERLKRAIRNRDVQSQEVDLLSYHDVMRNSLPTLLVNHVGEQYIANS